MHQIRAVVCGDEAQAVRQALPEFRGGKVHAKVQANHVLPGVVGIPEAFIGFHGFFIVGHIDDGFHARGLGGGVGFLIAVDFRIYRGRRTVQPVLSHAGGGDKAEIGVCFIRQMGIILTDLGAHQLMDHPLVVVPALFLHGKGYLHGLLRLVMPQEAGVGFGLFLFGNAQGGGQIAHVDGQNNVVFIFLDHHAADHPAVFHVGIVGAHGHLHFPAGNRYGHDIAVGKAFIQQFRTFQRQHQVAIFLNVRHLCSRFPGQRNGTKAQDKAQRKQRENSFLNRSVSFFVYWHRVDMIISNKSIYAQEV